MRYVLIGCVVMGMAAPALAQSAGSKNAGGPPANYQKCLAKAAKNGMPPKEAARRCGAAAAGTAKR
ncbi:MAG TPA: hypothetical protein VNR11_20130 [Xanthobacteraceae bacterium]|nr:hypothetical protein [Xanthobacteraceae bacterium]